jgi:hypothetical protein
VQARYQYITGVNPGPDTCVAGKSCAATTSAIAVFARVTYLLGEGDFRFFVGGSVGGGNIRHVSNFPADPSCVSGTSRQTCVDTISSGPFLIGPAVGFFYDLGSTASLIVAANTALGVRQRGPRAALLSSAAPRVRLDRRVPPLITLPGR